MDNLETFFESAKTEIRQLAEITDSLQIPGLPSRQQMKEELYAARNSPQALVELRKKYTSIEHKEDGPVGHFELLTIPSSIWVYEYMIKDVKEKQVRRVYDIFYPSGHVPTSDESYFFRCPDLFHKLAQTIEQKIKAQEKKGLVCMGAGTHNGLEAYSISIVIEEVIDKLKRNGVLSKDDAAELKANSVVYAVDRDPCVLRLAAGNKYEYNFITYKEGGRKRLNYYFERGKKEAYYSFKEGPVKDRVRFGLLDLEKFNPELVNGFDVIFLEGLPSLKFESVQPNLQKALKPDGVIITNRS